MGLLMWKQWDHLAVPTLCWQCGQCSWSQIWKEINIYYLLFASPILTVFTSVILFLKITPWNQNCYLLSIFFFKQVRGLKHQQGKSFCPKSRSLIVILTPDCLTAQTVFFLLKKCCLYKTWCGMWSKDWIESHFAFSLQIASVCVHMLAHACMWDVCVCLLLFLDCS